MYPTFNFAVYYSSSARVLLLAEVTTGGAPRAGSGSTAACCRSAPPTRRQSWARTCRRAPRAPAPCPPPRPSCPPRSAWPRCWSRPGCAGTRSCATQSARGLQIKKVSAALRPKCEVVNLMPTPRIKVAVGFVCVLVMVWDKRSAPRIPVKIKHPGLTWMPVHVVLD